MDCKEAGGGSAPGTRPVQLTRFIRNNRHVAAANSQPLECECIRIRSASAGPETSLLDGCGPVLVGRESGGNPNPSSQPDWSEEHRIFTNLSLPPVLSAISAYSAVKYVFARCYRCCG